MRKISLIALLLLGLLAACTLPAPPRPAAIDPEQLRGRLANLPGAELRDEEVGVSYPEGVLFAEGAALPLAGGTAVLDPLAALLIESPGVTWRGTVRAHTPLGPAYDRRLAEARAELLARYFRRSGVPPERLVLLAEEGNGPSFELAAGQAQSIPASSSREKR